MLELFFRDLVLGLGLCQSLHHPFGLPVADLFVLSLGVFIHGPVQLVQLGKGFVSAVLDDFILMISVVEELRAQSPRKDLQRLEVRLLILLALPPILLFSLVDFLLVYCLDLVKLVVLLQADELFIDEMGKVGEHDVVKRSLCVQ